MSAKSLVIFGATGDLCRRKLIPALHELHTKGLLPEDFSVLGCARREKTREEWLESLGEYPEDFSAMLDYMPMDLGNAARLMELPRSDENDFLPIGST